MFFQELIDRLNQFWTSHGVMIGQPYGLEVAAGTANPLTIFRVLGPEPFNVAYVEPSRRPADGMYGKNPNRFQHYFQYQIILKPAPTFNIQLYLDMLKAIGIEPSEHDIRFVEDNWSSPSLSAFGTGWEIWLDGMEITQYTYFQQVAGVKLDPPALEITLGLERLAMYIQNIDHYKDLQWNQDITYSDIFKQHEYWQSKYNFEQANVNRIKNIYEAYFEEAKELIDNGNYWAAYDMLLRMSHLFNILDARGVITYNQRMGHFKEMANLMHSIAKLYLEERKHLNYPLKKIKELQYSPYVFTLDTLEELIHKRNGPDQIKERQNTSDSAPIFVLELGFEPLPADYLKKVANAYDLSSLREELNNAGFVPTDIKRIITPNRIGTIVYGAQRYSQNTEKIYGPYKAQAFDKQGHTTKALEGFLNKYNVRLSDIKWVATPKGDRAVIELTKTVDLAKVVLEFFDSLFSQVQFKKMYWGKQGATAVRPLRWILSFYNNKQVNINYLGVDSGSITLVPWFIENGFVRLSSAQDYIRFIKAVGIAPDSSERYAYIQDFLKGKQVMSDESVIWENAMLTEAPVTSELILPELYSKSLPFEVIQAILEKNQRFILIRQGDKIHYTIVLNRPKSDSSELTDKIIKGYFKVVKARLDDGIAYAERDMEKNLAQYRNKLKSIPFSPRGKSLWHQVQRIRVLVDKLLKSRNLSDVYNGQLVYGVLPLIRNVRATILGQEYPEIEYAIAAFYAKHSGYTESICSVLKQMADWAPKCKESHLLSTAETLDSLVVLSQELESLKIGSKDPYQLRRIVHRLVDLLKVEAPISFVPLDTLLADAISVAQTQGFEIKYSADEFLDFILSRAVSVSNYKLPFDIVRGIYFNSSTTIIQKHTIAKALEGVQNIGEILGIFKRVNNILRKAGLEGRVRDLEINPALFEVSIEHRLYNFITELKNRWQVAKIVNEPNNFKAAFVQDLQRLGNLLENLFSEVMINTDNVKTRANRIALLNEVKSTLDQVLEIGKVWGN